MESSEQTQKYNIIQERVITLNFNTYQYDYFIARHKFNESTYYTRYYTKNRTLKFGKLELTEEETYEEVSSVISNLENIEKIGNILDLELFKEYVLNDLRKAYLKKQK